MSAQIIQFPVRRAEPDPSMDWLGRYIQAVREVGHLPRFTQPAVQSIAAAHGLNEEDVGRIIRDELRYRPLIKA